MFPRRGMSWRKLPKICASRFVATLDKLWLVWLAHRAENAAKATFRGREDKMHVRSDLGAGPYPAL